MGTLEVRLFDENEAPIANHPIVLGMVNSRARSRRATPRATPPARRASPACRSGQQTGYAAVIDWHGLRLNTAPFAMPESGGAARRDPRARRAPPIRRRSRSARGGRIVVQMREDALQILEFLPLENTSDKMFDPGPGAFEIPLPTGFVGAQPQENERKVEVRQNHGIAVHGPIVPKRSQLAPPTANARPTKWSSASCCPTMATRTTSRSRRRTAWDR